MGEGKYLIPIPTSHPVHLSGGEVTSTVEVPYPGAQAQQMNEAIIRLWNSCHAHLTTLQKACLLNFLHLVLHVILSTTKL